MTFCSCASRSRIGWRERRSVAPLRALAAEAAEERQVVLAARRLEGRQVHGVEVELEVAAIGDLHRVPSRLLEVREELVHGLGRPEAEKTLGLQPAFVAQCLAHPDAHVDLVRGCVAFFHVVDVVRGDEGDRVLSRDAQELLVDLLLPVAAVALQLEVVAVAEDVAHLHGRLRRPLHVSVAGVVGGLAGEARRLGDESLAVPGQKLLVDARERSRSPR